MALDDSAIDERMEIDENATPHSSSFAISELKLEIKQEIRFDVKQDTNEDVKPIISSSQRELQNSAPINIVRRFGKLNVSLIFSREQFHFIKF